MPKNSLNVALKGVDEIFSTEESRHAEQREQVQQIPIAELFPFKNHPFRVQDDEEMENAVKSISQYGVLTPLIARPRPEGGYEIISGHRRQHAAQLAGLETVPVIVRDMSDDAATILMVDSNRELRTAHSRGRSCRGQRDGTQCACHPGTACRSAAPVCHHHSDPGCAVRSRCYL